MKKEYLINIAMVLSIAVLFTSCDSRSTDYRMISVEAPFPMEPICEYIYPERDYVITDFGAVADTMHVNTEAIKQAVQACSKAGGGRVVIPAGEWVTGPIHLANNVNLHLKKDAVVLFTCCDDNMGRYGMLQLFPTCLCVRLRKCGNYGRRNTCSENGNMEEMV